MAKEAIKMKVIYELSNLEIKEYCMLNIKTGEMIFSDQKSNPKFTGLYFRDEITFFAIYPTKLGPEIYYNGNVYPIHKKLSISLKKNNKNREFCIYDYGINIKYKESSYIGVDVWSDEEDVDLFFMIQQRYQSNDFYEQYTN